MKKLGLSFLLVGLIWAGYAFNMDVTVTRPAETLGSGVTEITLPAITVNNLGLMDQRRNHLIFSGILFLAGVILFALGKSGAAISKQKTCPFCAESIDVRAVVCRFCQKDIPAQEPQKKEKMLAVKSPGPITVKYCPKCTGMNNGEATVCFRCESALGD